MLPHYPLYIDLQSQFSYSTPPPPIPFPLILDLPVLPHLSVTVSSLLLTVRSSHLVSGGGKVLAHATSVSPWLRLVIAAVTNTYALWRWGYRWCACASVLSDRHSPTFNTPQPDCLCLGLSCSLSTVQQPAHHFWLAFVCTISPLIPNAILTRQSV